MDDMKVKSIHFTAQKLTEEIQNMPVYKKFYSQIQVSYCCCYYYCYYYYY